MIVAWGIEGFLVVLQNTLGALPSSPTLGLNAQAGTLVGTGIFGGAGWLNAYMPLDAVMEGLGVVLALFAVMFIVRMVLYVLTKLHILGGNDA